MTTASRPAPGPLPLPPAGTLDLFMFTGAEAMSAATASMLASLLGEDEAQHIHHLCRPDDQHRALAARGLLRLLLSRYYPGMAAAAWRFTRNAHGKPALDSPHLQFNVSHTEGMIAIAFSHATCPVGVDAEPDGKLDAKQTRELYDLVLAPQERQALAALEHSAPAQVPGAFLRTWTLKEAWLKAAGTGLSIAPADFAIIHGINGEPVPEPADGFAPQRVEHLQLVQLLGRRWWLHHRQVHSTAARCYQLALAVEIAVELEKDSQASDRLRICAMCSLEEGLLLDYESGEDLGRAGKVQGPIDGVITF